MGGLRVLITNITLASRTGTEINVRDIALRLLACGHTPIVYSTELGEIAEEIRSATVPVVDDLGKVGITPDVIHGHHHPETMTALLHFPGVPAVFFCHDWMSWHDIPPRFPRILRYVAVDDTNRDRLAFEHGVPEDRLRVVRNTVDLERFRPRAPLPPRPRHALVFSNYASEHTHVGAVREACARAGLTLDVIGTGAGNPVARPEAVLGRYDIVFAKARCALEALAVGTAVVACGSEGVASMVTTRELEELRRWNFGIRALRAPLDPDILAREIARYDPAECAEVSRRVRATAGLDSAIDELVALYREVMAEQARSGGTNLDAEERAAAAYLRQWGPRFKDGALRAERDLLRAERDLLEEECRRLRGDRDALAAARNDRRGASFGWWQLPRRTIRRLIG